MRNISFSLTTPQFRARSKRVTRRMGWYAVKVGDQLQGVEKGMGLKKGEKVVRLGPIVVKEARQEPLSRMLEDPDYGDAECVREGFPELTPAEFVAMFCKHHNCEPSASPMRIEFDYL